MQVRHFFSIMAAFMALFIVTAKAGEPVLQDKFRVKITLENKSGYAILPADFKGKVGVFQWSPEIKKRVNGKNNSGQNAGVQPGESVVIGQFSIKGGEKITSLRLPFQFDYTSDEKVGFDLIYDITTGANEAARQSGRAFSVSGFIGELATVALTGYKESIPGKTKVPVYHFTFTASSAPIGIELHKAKIDQSELNKLLESDDLCLMIATKARFSGNQNGDYLSVLNGLVPGEILGGVPSGKNTKASIAKVKKTVQTSSARAEGEASQMIYESMGMTTEHVDTPVVSEPLSWKRGHSHQPEKYDAVSIFDTHALMYENLRANITAVDERYGSTYRRDMNPEGDGFCNGLSMMAILHHLRTLNEEEKTPNAGLVQFLLSLQNWTQSRGEINILGGKASKDNFLNMLTALQNPVNSYLVQGEYHRYQADYPDRSFSNEEVSWYVTEKMVDVNLGDYRKILAQQTVHHANTQASLGKVLKTLTKGVSNEHHAAFFIRKALHSLAVLRLTDGSYMIFDTNNLSKTGSFLTSDSLSVIAENVHSYFSELDYSSSSKMSYTTTVLFDHKRSERLKNFTDFKKQQLLAMLSSFDKQNVRYDHVDFFDTKNLMYKDDQTALLMMDAYLENPDLAKKYLVSTTGCSLNVLPGFMGSRYVLPAQKSQALFLMKMLQLMEKVPEVTDVLLPEDSSARRWFTEQVLIIKKHYYGYMERKQEYEKRENSSLLKRPKYQLSLSLANAKEVAERGERQIGQWSEWSDTPSWDISRGHHSRSETGDDEDVVRHMEKPKVKIRKADETQTFLDESAVHGAFSDDVDFADSDSESVSSDVSESGPVSLWTRFKSLFSF